MSRLHWRVTFLRSFSFEILMFTNTDHHIVITALRDLLAEFPPTTDPDAVSARHQARMVLKKYEKTLDELHPTDPAHRSDT